MPTAMLQKLTVSDDVRNDQTLNALVEAATDLLIEELGRFADTVEACWTSHADDLSQRIVRLSLSDWSGSVSIDFNVSQLADVARLHRQIVRLWGDLLEIRSNRHLERLHEVVQGLSDD